MGGGRLVWKVRMQVVKVYKFELGVASAPLCGIHGLSMNKLQAMVCISVLLPLNSCFCTKNSSRMLAM